MPTDIRKNMAPVTQAKEPRQNKYGFDVPGACLTAKLSPSETMPDATKYRPIRAVPVLMKTVGWIKLLSDIGDSQDANRFRKPSKKPPTKMLAARFTI